MDIKQFLDYCEANKDKHNKIIEECNSKIDGRVCVSSWLHYLLSLKMYLGPKCKTYVETGTLWGGSISCLLMLDNMNNECNVNTEYVGIDLFEGYYGNDCKQNDWNKTSIDINSENHLQHTTNNISKFNKNNNKVTLIKGSSYDENTVNEFKEKYDCIDLLFIDGDHSKEGVIKDFMNYQYFINKNGFILFDNYDQPTLWPGVKEGLDCIDFNEFGFIVIGQLGYSLLVQKINNVYIKTNNNIIDKVIHNSNNIIENTTGNNNYIEKQLYQFIDVIDKDIDIFKKLYICDKIKEIGFKIALKNISKEEIVDRLKEITFDIMKDNNEELNYEDFLNGFLD